MTVHHTPAKMLPDQCIAQRIFQLQTAVCIKWNKGKFICNLIPSGLSTLLLVALTFNPSFSSMNLLMFFITLFAAISLPTIMIQSSA